jgi:hypothetical protein
MTAEPLAAVLDHDAARGIGADPELLDRVRLAVERGELRLLTVGGVEQQAARAPEADREQAARVFALAEPAPTLAMPDEWVIGRDRLASAEESARHDEIRRKGNRQNPRKAHGDAVDALMVATAIDYGAVILTLDGSGKRPGLIQRAAEVDVRAVTPTELVELLDREQAT